MKSSCEQGSSEGSSPAAGRDAREDASQVFVGRSAELELLRAALGHATEGRGRVVMLAGPPGIGKTRTMIEFAGHARAAGALVLRGACYESEWAPPYGPIAEALTSHVRAADPATLREDLGFGAAPIARVVPAVRERLPDTPEPVALQPNEERFRLFDAVSQLLIAMAGRCTVALLLDDLHWADKGTVALLRHVARFAPEHRILIVGGYRDVEVDPTHPLADLLGTLRRESTFQRVLLEGLSTTETGELVAALAPQPVSQDLVGSIQSHTDGNPFFIREMLQHLAEEGALSANRDPNLAELAVPEGIRHVIGRRLARLSVAANHLLSVAAAFDGPFPYDIAAVVAGISTTETALELLDEALRARVIDPTQRPDAYDFTHALIRHALYTGLNPSRRALLHRKIAEALETKRGEGASEFSGQIAHHYSRSASLPGAERGAEHAISAADLMDNSHLYDHVARYLQIALALLPRSDERRPRLTARLALALARSFELDGAAQAAREAAAMIAETEGAGAAADYLAELTQAVVEAGSLRGAWEFAKIGLEYIGERRDLTWAWLAAYDMTRREATDPSNPGIILDSPERRAFTAVFEQHGQLHLTLSQPAESREDLLRRAGASPVVTSFFGGELRRGAEIWSAAATATSNLGKLAQAVMCYAQLARCHTALGNFSEAAAAREAGASLGRRVSGRFGQAMQLAGAIHEHRLATDASWATTHAEAGLLLDARKADALSIDTAEHYWLLAGIRACAAVANARVGAVEVSLTFFAMALPALERAPGWSSTYPALANDAAEVLWLLQRRDHIELVERSLHEKVLLPDFRFPMRDARLSMGRLSALQARYEEASEWFAKARTILDEQGARPLRAIADYDEALMHARRRACGDRERAVPLLEAALAQFRAIGMPGWIRRAETLLATGEEWTPVSKEISARETSAREIPAREQSSTVADGVASEQTASAATAAPGESEAACSNVFRKEGDYWTVAYEGRTVRLKDANGLLYLSQLLRHPGREFHVAEMSGLVRAGNGGGSRPAVVLERDAGAVLDPQATAAYRQRLRELSEEIESATEQGDLGRAESAREEAERIADELSAAYGLGGRARRVDDRAERLRKAVTNQIRRALKRIGAAHPALERHLQNALRTGLFCSYEPDRPLTWDV